MGLCGFLDRKKQRLSMYQSIGSPKGMQWGKILSHAVMWGNAALAVACLGGFLGYIIEAYVPSDMSNWKDVWSALFSFIASVFGAYTAFVELKTPIRERLGLNFAACVAYCVVLGVVDVVIFLCFVGFILDSEGAAAAWCFVGFVSVLGLLALEVDKARSAYIVSKGDEGKGRYLLINAECLDDDYYYDGSSTDNSGSVSTSVDSNNSKNSGGRLGANCEKLSICAVCTGFVVIVLALLVLMVFVVFTMRYSFAYVKMESIPGRGYKVKGGARLNIYCKGNASAEYPYTVLLEHDTDVPSPSMMPLLHALCQRGMRTCVYDRSGYGWSTRTKNRLPLGTKAAQAVELLEMAGEKPPFVVGAHGRGGFVAVEYVARYNESVAGVVLMDSYLIGQREKEIARIYHNNYKSSVNNVLGKEDALRAFAPFGAAHYSSLNRMKSVDKFLDENFTIKEKPRVTLREAFLWTM